MLLRLTPLLRLACVLPIGCCLLWLRQNGGPSLEIFLSTGRRLVKSRPSAGARCLRTSDVLRAEPEPDNPRRQPPQHLRTAHHPEGQRCTRPLRARQHAADHTLLDEDLESLGEPRRQLAPALHAAQVVDRNAAAG